MLPYVVHDIVSHGGSDRHVDVMSRQIGAFFAKHCTTAETHSLLLGHYLLINVSLLSSLHPLVLHLIMSRVGRGSPP